MTRTVKVAIVLGCVWVSASAVLHAQSRLLGDDYTLSFTNFPDNIGATEDPEDDRPRVPTDHGTLPAIVKFDGVEEIVAGMKVNERVVAWEGVPGGIPAEQASGIDGETEFDLIDWENAGEVVEFSWDTVSGGFLSNEELESSFITMRDLTWANSDPGSMPTFFETGWYMYFTKDGVGFTDLETILPDLGVLVGAHPFDKSVEEVFYIAYSTGQVEDITLPYEGGVDVTMGTSQLGPDLGWADLAEVVNLADKVDDINGLRIGFLVEPPTGEDISLPGDFNFDGVLNELDLNDLTARSASTTNPPAYDLNDDNLVNDVDINIWAKDLFGTWIGDADLNGLFDTGDLVNVLASGTYEVDVDSVWTTGDFNGDGRTNTGDLVVALADGGYEAGPRAAVAAVPEPASVTLLLFGSLMLMRRRRN